jgi:hypothetical protein
LEYDQTANADGGKPRIEEPQRTQGEMLFDYSEDALEPSHPARVLWDLLGKMDLKAFSKGCVAVEGAAGRALKSPRMLLALWLYVPSQAVGSDLGSLAPMVEQIEARSGQRPGALLADGGHVKSEDISATRSGVDVLVPPQETAKAIEKLKAEGADPQLIAWRERMDTDEAKQIYRARAGRESHLRDLTQRNRLQSPAACRATSRLKPRRRLVESDFSPPNRLTSSAPAANKAGITRQQCYGRSLPAPHF